MGTGFVSFFIQRQESKRNCVTIYHKQHQLEVTGDNEQPVMWEPRTINFGDNNVALTDWFPCNQHGR